MTTEDKYEAMLAAFLAYVMQKQSCDLETAQALVVTLTLIARQRMDDTAPKGMVQ